MLLVILCKVFQQLGTFWGAVLSDNMTRHVSTAPWSSCANIWPNIRPWPWPSLSLVPTERQKARTSTAPAAVPWIFSYSVQRRWEDDYLGLHFAKLLDTTSPLRARFCDPPLLYELVSEASKTRYLKKEKIYIYIYICNYVSKTRYL